MRPGLENGATRIGQMWIERAALNGLGRSFCGIAPIHKTVSQVLSLTVGAGTCTLGADAKGNASGDWHDRSPVGAPGFRVLLRYYVEGKLRPVEGLREFVEDCRTLMGIIGSFGAFWRGSDLR